jgi:hypothetical protein
LTTAPVRTCGDRWRPRIILYRTARPVRAWVAAALCAAGLAAAATPNAQGEADPRIGSWDELKTSTHYDSILRVFRNLDNGMIHMQVNGKLLESSRWHVDFRCDGGKYRTLTYDGKFVGMTYSCRRAAARTIESSFTRGSRADRCAGS